MDLEVAVFQVLLELAAEVNGRMLELGNLDPRVMLVLPCHLQVLHDEIGLARKGAVYFHGSLGVAFGHLKEMAQNVDHGLVEDLEKRQEIQDQQAEYSDGDFVLGLVQNLLAELG